MHDEMMGVEKLPEFFDHFCGKFRRDAAQVGQLFGNTLHVRFRERAQHLLGQLLAHGDQQDRRLAHPGEIGSLAPPRRPALDSLLCQNPFLSLSPPTRLISFMLPPVSRSLRQEPDLGQQSE